MKRYLWLPPFALLLVSILVISLACSNKYGVGPVGASTSTPTVVSSATVVGAATATSTPGCASYRDQFSSNTLSNYDYSTQVATTAGGADYQIAGGVLEVAPSNSANNGGLAIVDNSFFSHSLSYYTAEADFEMDSYQGVGGLFGIAFNTGSNGSFYCFQWNGDGGNANGGTPDWELEKNSGSSSVSFSYLGSRATSYGYTLGKWIHLKVVVAGNNFQCYVNQNDGTGDHLIYNVTDNSLPYTSGGAGVRTYGISSPNVARVDNLFLNAQSCVGVPTSFPTSFPTLTVTFTATSTATNTPMNTPTNTPTVSATCITYSDNFSTNTLSNYDYFLNSNQTASTAAGCDYTISGGFLTVDPTSSPGTNNGGLAIVDNSLFNNSLTHYTITASFEMDNTTDSEGLFGIAFRTGSNGSFYCFQWNNDGGGAGTWQVEKNTGAPSVSFSYPASGTATPAYVLGSTCTLQVVATGNTFVCYANLNDGTGNHLIYTATDFSSPFTSGGVGVRTYGVHQGNKINVSNFSVDTCP